MSLPLSSRVYVTVYYDDTANYFYQLEGDLEKHKIQLIYLCHNLSAFLFLKFRSHHQVIYINGILHRLTWLYHMQWSTQASVELPPYVDRLVVNTKSRRRWSSELLALQKFVKSLATENAGVILSGEDRPLEWLLKRKFKHRVCFEQGPFNTTTMSHSGVNANLESSDKLPCFFPKEKFSDEVYFERSSRALRSPGYRIVDFASYFLSRCFLIGMPSEDADWSTLGRKIRSKAPMLSSKFVIAEPAVQNVKVLLVLQVYADVNNLIHTPVYNIEKIVRALLCKNEGSFDIQIMMRPHPLETAERLKDIAKQQKKFGFDVSRRTLSEDLTWSDVVLTSNSTVGIEAYLIGLPVVAFGKSYWEGLSEVKRAFGYSEMLSQVELAFSEKININKQARRKEVSNFLRSHFIPGHFRFEILSRELVSQWILHELEQRQS